MERIKITSGRNGYPQNIREGVTGFSTFAEAEDFAKDNGGSVCLFHRREGWHYWENKGVAYEPMHIGYQDYGDDYNVGWEPEEEFPLLQEMLAEAESIEDMKREIAEYEKILDVYNTIDVEEEAIVTYRNEYYETIPRQCMAWAHDTHLYEIGVDMYIDAL